MINPQVHISGKQIISKKFKVKGRINQIPATVKINYGGGLLWVSIDNNDYEFNKGDEFLVDSKLCKQIDLEKWSLIMKNDSEKISKKKKGSCKVRKTYIYPKEEFDSDESNSD